MLALSRIETQTTAPKRRIAPLAKNVTATSKAATSYWLGS